MNVLDHLHARVYDRMVAPMERRGLADRRRQLLAAVSGDVLEIGAGTGANIDAYPDTVTTLTLTEPSPPMARRLRQHVARARPDTTVVEAAAEHLPFDDASFDVVVTTLVLCSVGSLAESVREIRRVLRPRGELVVLEHVAAKGRSRALQRLVEPAQKVIGRNCHLTRDVRSALDGAGFDTSRVVDETVPGAPGWLFPAVAGIATRS